MANIVATGIAEIAQMGIGVSGTSVQVVLRIQLEIQIHIKLKRTNANGEIDNPDKYQNENFSNIVPVVNCLCNSIDSPIAKISPKNGIRK